MRALQGLLLAICVVGSPQAIFVTGGVSMLLKTEWTPITVT